MSDIFGKRLDSDNWPNLKATRCPKCGLRVFEHIGINTNGVTLLDPRTGDAKTHMFRHIGSRCVKPNGIDRVLVYLLRVAGRCSDGEGTA
jgi:hypothetical protein